MLGENVRVIVGDYITVFITRWLQRQSAAP